MSYVARVARIESIVPIPKADRIVQAFVKGYSVIVSASAKVGDIGLLFIDGGEIAPWFLSSANLYRHSHLNKDTTKAGFFEDNGRVRTVRLKGVPSEAFFISDTQTLGILGLREGDELTEFNGEWLCRDYIRRRTAPSAGKKGEWTPPKAYAVPEFLEHVDTHQFRFYDRLIETPGAYITITQKYHGTSGRFGHHEVEWSPVGALVNPFGKLLTRLARGRYGRYLPTKKLRRGMEWVHRNLLKVVPKRRKMDYVVGSRRVDLWDAEGYGYHGKNAPRFEVLNWLKPVLKPGVTIYGEHVGYFNGAPIMPPHDLRKVKDPVVLKQFNGKPEMVYGYFSTRDTKDHAFIIYRVTIGGKDLEADLIPGFVAAIDHPKVFAPAEIFQGTYQGLKEIAASGGRTPTEFIKAEANLFGTIGDPLVLNEGVVIRVDVPGAKTRFLKEKSFVFKVLEEIVQEEVGDPEKEDGLVAEGDDSDKS